MPTIQRWPAQILLLLSFAALHALVYPWPNLWPLAHISLVPLTVLALHGGPRWRVAALTYAVGVVWVLFMIQWIRPLFPVGFVLMGLYIPLIAGVPYVLLLPLIHRRCRLPLVLAVPLVWVALEWLRGAFILGGFPYFLQGQSQPTAVIQIADLVGVYGVSFVVCMSNGMICDLVEFFHRQDAKSAEDRKERQKEFILSNESLGGPLRSWRLGGEFFFSAALWFFVFGASLAYGGWRISQAPSAHSPGIRVAVVQTNVPQSRKSRAGEERVAEMFADLLRLSEEALSHQPDLIVWPETAIPRAIDAESARLFERWGVYREQIVGWSAEHDVALLVGALATPWPPENRPPAAAYNSAYLFTPHGPAGRYDKVHRLPLGEYVPLCDDRPWAWRWAAKLTPQERANWILPGESYNVLDLPGRGAFAVPICFEDVFTTGPRRMVWDRGRKRVDFLVNISNDGWFAGSAQGPQHEQMARFRCVENRVPMARAVNTGISGFIDSTGRVIARVEVNGKQQHVAGTSTATMRYDNRTTLYGRIGDALPIGCMLLTSLLAITAIVRRTARWLPFAAMIGT